MLLEELKLKIISRLGSDRLIFSYPPDPSLGDISLACFNLAKERQTSPAAAAADWARQLPADIGLKEYFSDIKAVGPYLNFFIAPEYLAAGVMAAVKKEGNRYGFNSDGAGRKVMLEFSNGNTHKEFHVGHVRNISYGDTISHLLAANGYESIPVSYINDFGINVAKTIWNWRRDPVYGERPEPKGYLLGRCYAKASRLLEENPEGKREVAEIMKEIESRKGKNYEFWRETRQWSIDYFFSVYKELDISFRHIFYESEVIDAGLALVKELIAKGILRKSEGAIIADLEQYGLGVLPIIRSDGTALYAAADLALASEKFKKYDLDRSIYIVDIRQSLYFQQLFKILELIGYRKPMIHLPYDFVTLPGGMMSSRSGNVITYQELKDKISERVRAETKERHAAWTAAHLAATVKYLTLATMKFEMLKVSADKIITFNIEEAAKFDGYTACYIQYCYARLQSIRRKGGLRVLLEKTDWRQLSEKKEKILLLKIAKYPEIIRLAGIKYNPSDLTKYLFELAQLTNDYYHEINILKAEPKIKKARLALVSAVSQVIANGFSILGIKVLEEM